MPASCFTFREHISYFPVSAHLKKRSFVRFHIINAVVIQIKSRSNSTLNLFQKKRCDECRNFWARDKCLYFAKILCLTRSHGQHFEEKPNNNDVINIFLLKTGLTMKTMVDGASTARPLRKIMNIGRVSLIQCPDK